MSPRPVHGLDLANDAFFEIKPALPPPENLGHGRLALERTVDRMAHRAVGQVNFTVAAARLESESPAALTEAAHLQNLGGGKLVEVADEGMARIDSFRGRSSSGERGDKILKLFPQISLARVARDVRDLLLGNGRIGVLGPRRKTDDLQ